MMKNKKLNVKDKYVNAILASTQYTGSHGHERILSASGIDNDILPLYLKIKYGSEQKNSLSQSTIGTLLHSGVDLAFKDDADTSIALRRKMKIEHGFTLSGETDVEFYDSENQELIIIDNKCVKYKTYEDLMSGKKTDYLTQLKAYEYLAKNVDKRKYKSIRVYLAFYFKDGTFYGKKPIPDFLLVNFTNRIISDAEFEEKINAKTEQLDMYLKDETLIPDECSELYWNASTTPKKKQRCISFCDVSNECPYYKEQKKFYKNRHNESVSKLLAGL